MAQIYSYPVATPLTSDLLLGSRTDNTSGEVYTYNFSVADVQSIGSAGLITASPVITTALVNAINATPIPLVAAQGSNNIVNILSIVAYVNNPAGGQAYSFVNDLLVKINGVTVGTLSQPTINTAAGTSKVEKLAVSGGLLQPNSVVELTSAAAPTTANGTGSLGISIKYEVLNTGVSF